MGHQIRKFGTDKMERREYFFGLPLLLVNSSITNFSRINASSHFMPKPYHPSQHPHIHHFCVSNMRVLNYPTLRSIQHNWSNNHVKLTFKFRWHFLITQIYQYKPKVTSSLIIIFFIIIKPKYLKTTSLF